jgi:formamidopyrimidine-DNA glycosylase
MDLIATKALGEHPWFKGLGPEPVGGPVGCGFDAAYLAGAAAGRAAPIKSLLLDQRVIAGLGNIYVCEALHRAGIAPDHPAGKVSRRKLTALTEAIRQVLAEAIEAGGSTLRDYAAADGSLGYFQHRFAVYGREGEPCLKPGCRGRVERFVQAGRSSYACSRCQT